MGRARVKRRELARLQAKENMAFQRALTGRGIMARIAKVNVAVAPSAAFFWKIVKDRIAARELLGPIRTLEVVQRLAMRVLEELGHDLDGIILKVTWRPPVLLFEAVPSAENAVAVVDQVRTSERGAARLAEIRALGG